MNRTAVGSWAADTLESVSAAARTARRALAPLFDLAVRLALARVFFVSAIVKLANWETALLLARDEYPVSWMDPVSAAYVGVGVELLGAILLALGLGTRAAALALFVLALVIQFNYRAFDEQLLWAALCAWYVLRGAGPLSLDRAIIKGIANSALPFAAYVVRALDRAGTCATPVALLALRSWLAVAVIGALGGLALPSDAFVVASARAFVTPVVAACALLWWLGLAARPAALLAIAGLVAHGIDGAQGSSLLFWCGALGLIVINGPGALALDHPLRKRLARHWPALTGDPVAIASNAPHVVIVGAGFGGMACAMRLAREAVHVTLIDRRNYHLFQPLLYQVATAGLAPGDIAQPVRSEFRDAHNVRVLLGEIVGATPAANALQLAGGQQVHYDYLVLATGASHSYFGRDEWAAHAPGLKRIEDATEVRRRLLLAFEQAEACDDPCERDALLTFLVVGGGPTGVELAGAIAELARLGMDKEFRRFDPADARVVLVQSGARLLPAFPERLSAITQRSLERLGVSVRLNSRVEQIDANGVSVNGKRIAARTVLWAAGVAASDAAKWLGAPSDGAGRIRVGADLSVPGLAHVFAIGDTAASNGWDGQPVPGLAPAARQAGLYVAARIAAHVRGRPAPAPFRYRHVGSLATIGRKAAVADFGRVRLSGALAWWLWGAVHVGFLLGVRNRVSVMFDWVWAYLTYKSGTRLITGAAHETLPRPALATTIAPRPGTARTLSSSTATI